VTIARWNDLCIDATDPPLLRGFWSQLLTDPQGNELCAVPPTP
jgi:hypothetical protein